MSSVGSEVWNNGARYTGQWQNRLQYMLRAVPASTISNLAQALRGGHVRCTVSDTFSAGNYNIVRRVDFEDNVRWILRLRMPELTEADWVQEIYNAETEAGFVKRQWNWTAKEQYSMRSEIATMNLIQYERSTKHVASRITNTDHVVDPVQIYPYHESTAMIWGLIILLAFHISSWTMFLLRQLLTWR